VAAGGDLLRIAAEITGGTFFSGETLSLLPLVASTALGRLLSLRMALSALSGLVLLADRPQRKAVPWAVGALGLAVVVTFSLAGHSAAALGHAAWPVISDLVHLTATSIWYGGLCCLLFLPWARLRKSESGIGMVSRTIDRFSRAGVVTMALLAVTGLILAMRQLYGVRALVEHPYGETLAVKLLFLVGVLALAGFNHLNVKRRLGASGAKAASIVRSFRWAVVGEVILGLAVVGSAGILSTTAPPQGEPFRVTVTITEGAITPSNIELPMNKPIRMTVVNRGKGAHAWISPELTHEMEAHAHGGMAGLIFYVEPGQAYTQTFVLRQPGRFAVQCEESGPTPTCSPGSVTVR
jgi:putative copper export protein